MATAASTCLLPAEAAVAAFRRDVLEGLNQRPKRLPCKYFYDRHGSQLFDAICEQPEYYLTRTEKQIMQEHAREMAAAVGPHVMLIELGSGSSIKTRMLLGHLEKPAAYVPVDIAREHLLRTARCLRGDYPWIEVLPVCADFADEFDVPLSRRAPWRRVVYFPGSTIGNFEHDEAVALLQHVGEKCGLGGGLLIGIDLEKDPATIEAAYNDAAGVTAEFNRNLLRRINRELNADFDLSAFRHHAFYDRQHARVDIRLISRCEQRVHVAGMSFAFAAGEGIHTEYSHKYTIERFAEQAREGGFELERQWTDAKRYFGVLFLVNGRVGKPKS